MVERFAEFKELKHIDKTTMISVLEESFRNVLAKMFGTDENLDVIMNPDKGDGRYSRILKSCPTERFTESYTQISLSDARADSNPDVEIGEEHTREIIFEKFDAALSLNLRQTSSQKSPTFRKKPFSHTKGREG